MLSRIFNYQNITAAVVGFIAAGINMASGGTVLGSVIAFGVGFGVAKLGDRLGPSKTLDDMGKRFDDFWRGPRP